MPDTSSLNPQSAEPLLAGTLALMTFYADRPSVAAMQKIGRNLQCLHQHPALSAEMSLVCRRLAAYWLTLGCDVEPADGPAACRFAAAPVATQ